MASDPFVHLHLHTHYSTLDGAVQAGPLMKAAKADGMPAVAITDHGNMFGAIEFYRAAQKAGVKPILGCEVYMAPGSRHDRSAGSARDAAYHFTLLAETAEGYQNLSKLVSAGFLEGYYYKPRIDKEILARHAKGLIALSGCLKGEVNMLLSQAKHEQARAAMGQLRDIFGQENLFVELHNHGLSQQRQNNPLLVEMARDMGLGLVAANDVHFLERSHHESHDVLVCIGTGANVSDTKRMHYSPELYFKRSAEMRELFAELPEACDNTLRIAERCNVTIEFGKPKYPEFTPPDGKGRVEYLRELTWAGLEHRFGERARTDQELRGRLEYELGVLEKSGFTSYFLIVWDFIRHARDKGIPVGPGRGSAAGSLVAFALGITDIDPIRFQLLFERFLNPERVSPPDIDVDFCQTRRAEVIDYVRQKYGESRVGQIITFGTLSSKAVLKDVNRVLGGSFADGDRLSKLIPLKGQIPYDLPEAVQINKELKTLVETDAQVKTIWQHATVLEGLVRGTGVHAAGVVIGSEDLTNFVPLARDKDGQVITQFDGNTLNDLGLLKMDFLGLKTLTLIEDALTLIRARKAPDFDINTIPFDDPATVEMLNKGETIGVFQLESGGMVNLCKQFDMVGLDDIIALIALYRPGPMELIPDYIARKKGKTKIKYAHPLLEKVCADTFGIMIYQEQVMAAANLLAGYSLGGADMLRRAMGKKDVEKMKQERSKFIEGCWKTNEIGPDKANEIFDLLEKFAGYGFNRSHSAAYGWVSWQTAYLKANFPVEFMAATLSNAIQASDATEKISVFVAECRRMNLEILPPDVNKSSLKFVPEGEEGIRFGLAGIKGVGEAAVTCILEERERKGPFASLDDFCLRLDSKLLNKKLLESLVKCGAFDAFEEPRERAFARLDQVVSTAQRTQREKAIGQFSLFEDFGGAPGGGATVGLNEVVFTPWNEDERLGFEKELLGFYLSGHPLEAYRELIEKDKYRPLANIAEVEDRGTFHAIVWIADVQKKFAKKDNRPFAVVFIEDLATQIETTVWSEGFEKYAALLEPKKVVQVRCRVDRRGEEPKVSLDDIKPVKAPVKKPEGAKPSRPRKPKALTTPLRLRFEVNDALPTLLDRTHGALSEFPGSQPVEFELALADGRVLVCRAHAGLKVDARPELTERLGGCLALET